MKNRVSTILLCVASSFLVAATLGSPLPTENDLEMVKYLRQVYHNHANIPVGTTDPDGARLGMYGDLYIWVDSGWAKMCKNDSASTEGSTSWTCDTITASTIVFEGATEDEWETTIQVTDPTADNTITIPDDDVDLTSAAPNFTFSTSNAAGTADTLIRSNSTIALFDATTPASLTIGGSGSVGTAGVASRRDHVHAVSAETEWQFVETLTVGASVTSSTLPTNSDVFKIVFDGVVGFNTGAAWQLTLQFNSGDAQVVFDQVSNNARTNLSGEIIFDRLFASTNNARHTWAGQLGAGGNLAGTTLNQFGEDTTNSSTITAFTVACDSECAGKLHLYKLGQQ